MTRLELKIPPAMQFLVMAGLMWAAARLGSFAVFSNPLRKPAVLVLLVVGGAFGAAGIQAFRRARTTIHPHRPENAARLVTRGLYRISRNPMYLGLLLILTAWAMALSNILAFLGPPLFVAGMNRLQIGPEERILRDKFGAAFDDYCRSVRRWL
jgi:protein-S-isoprenylcysteine O-methyltransferase Ste14